MNRESRQPGLAAKHNEAASLVAQMTLQEKTALSSGKSFWYLQACERLNIPAVMVTDGPHGLRKQQTGGDHVGLNASVPATCFPTASALAASWNVDLLHEIGVALGEQCVAESVAVLLGPGMNIKRHPRCGRNFEYFSEDPLLSGELAAAMINGVQSQGVGTSIKHFAVNNQEHGRMYVDAIVDERTLREIYLRGFEIAVRAAQPWTVMCAYNRLNGTYCGEHDWLLNRVLRNDWGFEGLVMTDWGATNDRVQSVTAGLDLEMPGSGGVNNERIEAAVAAGDLSEADLDRIIVRNVSLALCGSEQQQSATALDQQAHHALARKAAGESVVLLKNDDAMLPLQNGVHIAVVGAFAERPRFQGAGSSQVRPTQVDNALEAIQSLVGAAGQVHYAPGYDPVKSGLDDGLIETAVAVATAAEVAVVFAGLPGIYESEGFDREHLQLPEQHDRLIEAVCAANPNTVVVLSNGAPVVMPWVAQPRAIVEGYLAGQAGGGAIADLLFGQINPSGKLAETFPLAQADVPSDPWFPGGGRQVHYREGLYVGYRYYDSAARAVLFPFGHGLSYTRFEYSNLTVSGSGSDWVVRFTLTNSGAYAGAEVVQLYVHDAVSTVYRPEQELKAFVKVPLAAGASTAVVLTLDARAFACFDTAAQDWVIESGAFELRVASSSRDIRLRKFIDVTGTVLEAPSAPAGPVIQSDGLMVDDTVFAAMLGRRVPAPETARPFHMNSALHELKESWLGSQVHARMVAQFGRQMGVGGSDATVSKMFEEMANHMPLRALALFSRGKIDFKRVSLLVALLNHRYLEAIRILFGKTPSW